MVQNLAITIPSISRSTMSIHSSVASVDSPTSSVLSEPITFAEIPLTALGKNTRRQLSYLLNSKKILRSEEGYERDWRGIAALARQKSLCDEKSLSGDDPMTKVLQLWCSNNPKTATVGHLERFLGIIDRWDVCDDIYENLVEDSKTYNTQQQQRLQSSTAEHSDTTQSQFNIDDDFGLGSDPNILTKDDVLRAQKGLPPQRYDAFVLFADADINYAVEILTKLEENPEYNFKLCLKDRDLLTGVSFAHVALTQLIEERCKHLIVILTAEFLKSPENKFLVNYTQALQIQHKTRKIIPLVYDDSIVIPRTLQIYTHLRYNASAGGLFNFWVKLATSIQNVSLSAEAASPPAYTNDVCSPSKPLSPLETLHKSSFSNTTPSPPTEIPSISINGHALTGEESLQLKKVERTKLLKSSNLRRKNKLLIDDGLVLRNAHSTGQLDTAYHNSAASMSDLSSTTSYSETKKKNKWPSKLLKKVFSRSSSKLQETA